VKERPILFSATMVRAILDGRKTMTRRACKPLNAWEVQDCREARLIDGVWHEAMIGAEQPYAKLRCPYGQPGDRLWVRETWRENEGGHAFHYAADGTILSKQRDPEVRAFFARRAPLSATQYKWRPSIFMPRAASRITLEVTGVRVERLQDISEHDAKAEGIRSDLLPANDDAGHPNCICYVAEPDDNHAYVTAKSAFEKTWENINGAGSWAANPWVWVVEFKRCS